MLEYLNDPPLWLALNFVLLSAGATLWSIWREHSIEHAFNRPSMPRTAY